MLAHTWNLLPLAVSIACSNIYPSIQAIPLSEGAEYEKTTRRPLRRFGQAFGCLGVSASHRQHNQKANRGPFLRQSEKSPPAADTTKQQQRLSGHLPPNRSTHRMHRCPKSTGSQYIMGQPPTMHWMPSALQAWAGSPETLPALKDRWNQTRRTSRCLH